MSEITLTIDYGNGASMTFTGLAWHESMTLGSALMAAKEIVPGLETTTVDTNADEMIKAICGVAPKDGHLWILSMASLVLPAPAFLSRQIDAGAEVHLKIEELGAP